MSVASPKIRHTTQHRSEDRGSKSAYNLTRECISAAVLAAILAVFVLRLWDADLSIPMAYFGDSVALGATVKGVIENTWFLSNPSLGAPHGQIFADYPMSEYLHLLCLKVLGYIGPTYAWAMNVYYLLSFPLTAAISVWVLRRLGTSFGPSILAAILFSFLPFRLYRSIPHLFYSAYFLVPIVIFLALQLSLAERVFERGDQPGTQWWRRASTWYMSLLIVCLGGTGIYGVFFAMFFIALGACYGAVRHRTSVPLREGAIIVIGLLLCTLLATAPSLVYAHEHGKNTLAVERGTNEAEIYGLRIAQLLMPIPDHRLAAFASFRRRYDAQGVAVPVNENGTASLGIVGALGLLSLMIYVLGWHDRFHQPGLFPALSAFGIWALLLATMGGLSVSIAMLVTPKIRAYNRISPYIAFFALAAVAIILDSLLRRGGALRRSTFIAIPLLLTAGMLDQTSNTQVPDYKTIAHGFNADKRFVNEIEKDLPPGSLIFQLPYIPWPENPGIHSLPTYELLRGYLHSRTLRWSYAAMKGRPADSWLQDVSFRPLHEMVDVLAIAGFSGIYVDLRGFADRGIETSLTDIVGKPRVVSEDGTRVFFALDKYAMNLRSGYSEAHWNRMRDEVLHPIVARWVDGCSFNEGGSGSSRWRWCEDKATFSLYNFSNTERQVRLSTNVTTGLEAPSDLTVNFDGVSRTFRVLGHNPTSVDLPLTLKPGTTLVHFHSTSLPMRVPTDPRKLVLRLGKFEVSDGSLPASFEWESGCSGPEKSGLLEWRWCSDAATLMVNNPGSATKQLAVDLAFRLRNSDTANVEVTAPGVVETLQTSPGLATFRRVLSIPAGISRVRLRTDSKPLTVSRDTKAPVMQVVRFYSVDLSSFPVLYVN